MLQVRPVHVRDRRSSSLEMESAGVKKSQKRGGRPCGYRNPRVPFRRLRTFHRGMLDTDAKNLGVFNPLDHHAMPFQPQDPNVLGPFPNREESATRTYRHPQLEKKKDHRPRKNEKMMLRQNKDMRKSQGKPKKKNAMLSANRRNRPVSPNRPGPTRSPARDVTGNCAQATHSLRKLQDFLASAGTRKPCLRVYQTLLGKGCLVIALKPGFSRPSPNCQLGMFRTRDSLKAPSEDREKTNADHHAPKSPTFAGSLRQQKANHLRTSLTRKQHCKRVVLCTLHRQSTLAPKTVAQSQSAENTPHTTPNAKLSAELLRRAIC